MPGVLGLPSYQTGTLHRPHHAFAKQVLFAFLVRVYTFVKMRSGSILAEMQASWPSLLARGSGLYLYCRRIDALSNPHEH